MRHKGKWKIFYALKYAFFFTSEAIKTSQSYPDYRGKASEYYFNGYTQI